MWQNWIAFTLKHNKKGQISVKSLQKRATLINLYYLTSNVNLKFKTKFFRKIFRLFKLNFKANVSRV